MLSSSDLQWSEPLPKSQTLESPIARRRTLYANFQIVAAALKKQAVNEDISPSALIFPRDVFFEHLLPPLRSPLDVNATIKSLKKKKVIMSGRFKCFAKNPAVLKDIEDVLFKKRLEPLIKDIIDTAVQDTNGAVLPTMKFVCNPNQVPTSNLRDNLSRPDCYILPIDADTKRIKWTDIVMPGELKKENHADKSLDNKLKITWSLHHCMCEDPCRRFSFGMTMENNMMRLWFFCRERVLVSETFNYITKPELTVRVVLSLLFAPPHLLGYDPTMERRADGQYDITVHPRDGTAKIYRTVRLLSDLGADSSIGRASRVWEVRQVVQGVVDGPPLILKDTWIDENRHLEGDIYQHLRRLRVSGSHYLEVDCHGPVRIDAEGQIDHTRVLSMRHIVIPRDGPTLALENQSEARRGIRHTATGLIFTPRFFLPNSIPAHPKVHYRMILAGGVHRALHRLTVPADIFRALSSACTAVHELHKVAWYHRDLTPGNILVPEDMTAVQAILVDLEYAKSALDKSTHFPRSGNCEFRAMEAVSRRYKFLASPFRGDRGRFRYNPLHELESLWWIAVYFLVDREIYIASQRCEATNGRQEHARTLFYAASADGEPSESRHNMLESTKGDFKQLVQTLHPSVHSTGQFLDDLRTSLVDTYTAVERNLSAINHTVADNLVEEFCKTFLVIAESFGGSSITVREFPSDVASPLGPSRRKKRKATDPDTVDGGAEAIKARPIKKKKTLLGSLSIISGPASRTRSRVRLP